MSMYRSPPATPTCARHPVAPAVEQCRRCRANVCSPCSIYVGLGVSCSRCAAIARDRRIWRRIIMFVIVPEAIATITCWVLAAEPDQSAAPPMDLLIACAEPCKSACDSPLIESAYAQDPTRTEALLRTPSPACEAQRRSLASLLEQDLRARDWRAAAWTAHTLISQDPDCDIEALRAGEALWRRDFDYARLYALRSLHERPTSPVSYPILLAVYHALGHEELADDLVGWADCHRDPGCNWSTARLDDASRWPDAIRLGNPPGYLAVKLDEWGARLETW
jgi:hypothetical protein